MSKIYGIEATYPKGVVKRFRSQMVNVSEDNDNEAGMAQHYKEVGAFKNALTVNIVVLGDGVVQKVTDAIAKGPKFIVPLTPAAQAALDSPAGPPAGGEEIGPGSETGGVASSTLAGGAAAKSADPEALDLQEAPPAPPAAKKASK